MKSYTLDKIDEARDALIHGDQLGCMAALNELASRHERLLQAQIIMKQTYERQHNGIDQGAT